MLAANVIADLITDETLDTSTKLNSELGVYPVYPVDVLPVP